MEMLQVLQINSQTEDPNTLLGLIVPDPGAERGGTTVHQETIQGGEILELAGAGETEVSPLGVSEESLQGEIVEEGVGGGALVSVEWI